MCMLRIRMMKVYAEDKIVRVYVEDKNDRSVW